jgi:hypothetical protein
VTFIPSSNKYRHFEYEEGDSDDVGTNTWDCPTCTRSMPPTTGAKKGDTFECKHCGCKVEIVYPPMRIERTTIRIVEKGDEPRWRLVMDFGGMKLLL